MERIIDFPTKKYLPCPSDNTAPKKNLAASACVCLWLILLCFPANAQTKQPKTVRDYFFIVAKKYFSIDCCNAKINDYLKNYLQIEDTANGYMKGGGDAAQEGFEMALFKRPDGTRLIGFYIEGEGGLEDTPWCFFLEYKNGRLTDVSRKVVPHYSKEKLVYRLPRKGTTVEVFERDENGEDWNRGKKLYDLVWSGGKFTVKK